MAGDGGNERVTARVRWTIRGLLRWWLIVPLLLVIAYSLAVSLTGDMLETELRAMKARGDPVTLKDAVPTIPPGARNAADLYQQAFDVLPLDCDPSALLKSGAAARSAVAHAAPGLELLHEATEIQDCAFSVDWKADPWSWDQTPRAAMRNAARWLYVEARVLTADGRPDDALRACGAIFRLGTHAQSHPTEIPEMVGIAIYELGLGALRDCLQTGEPSPEACRDLFNELGRVDLEAAHDRAIRGESAWALDAFTRLRHGDPGTVWALGGSAQAGAWLDVAWLQVYRTAGRPFLNLDELAFVEYAQGKRSSTNGWPMCNAIPSGHVDTHATSYMAAIAVARAALALRACQAKQGRYPGSLAELSAVGWKLPKDPFGGADLRYRREKRGFAVWSVGPNMANDQAVEYDSASMSLADGPYDIVFRVKR